MSANFQTTIFITHDLYLVAVWRNMEKIQMSLAILEG